MKLPTRFPKFIFWKKSRSLFPRLAENISRFVEVMAEEISKVVSRYFGLRTQVAVSGSTFFLRSLRPT